MCFFGFSVVMIGYGIGFVSVGSLVSGGGFIQEEHMFFLIFVSAPVVSVVLLVLLTLVCYLWSPYDSGGDSVVAGALQWYWWVFVVALLYQCQFYLSLFEIFHQIVSVSPYVV